MSRPDPASRFLRLWYTWAIVRDHPHIVALAGPSCSGKTTVARALAEALAPAEVTLIAVDSYYRDLSHADAQTIDGYNFDDPAAIDHPLLRTQVEALAAGRAVQRPVYDHATHTRAARTELVTPGAFVILEGLFALYWDDVCRHARTRVFIDAQHDVCLARRLERDTRERARTPEEVHRRYRTNVVPMYERYVLPTRVRADICVNGVEPVDRCVARILAEVPR